MKFVSLLQMRTTKQLPLIAILGTLTLLAWIMLIVYMPDTHHYGNIWTLHLYMVMWVTMITAMMLPSAIPMILVFGHTHKNKSKKQYPIVSISIFLIGYLIAWALYGYVTFAVYQIIWSFPVVFHASHQFATLISGVTVIVAGVYQLTPFKQKFLRKCRHTLPDVQLRWREGKKGACLMGIGHGLHCVGSCWGLMLVMFAMGHTNLVWMGVLALLTLLEKVLLQGEKIAKGVGVGLIALGMWIVIDPGSVPFFTVGEVETGHHH